MKTTTLPPTEQKVLDYIEKFSDVSAELIVSGTQLNKLLVFKTVKVLAEKKQITINAETTPPTYKIIKGEKDSKTITKKVAKKDDEEEIIPKVGGRDTSRFKFQGNTYPKSRLVLAILTEHCKRNVKISISKLNEIWPPQIQKKYGVIVEQSRARKNSPAAEKRDRYFFGDDMIKLSDGKRYCVTNQWSSENIVEFLKISRAIGYKFTKE